MNRFLIAAGIALVSATGSAGAATLSFEWKGGPTRWISNEYIFWDGCPCIETLGPDMIEVYFDVPDPDSEQFLYEATYPVIYEPRVTVGSIVSNDSSATLLGGKYVEWYPSGRFKASVIDNTASVEVTLAEGDLITRVYMNSYNMDINQGDITVYGRGYWIARLDGVAITPVPVPPALPLYAFGLIGLGLIGRARKTNSAA